METAIPTGAALKAAIETLRRQKNAVILAHYYQDFEIQDVADFVGDSLDLSRRAQAADADIIVFCGVRFMAEVAKILNPERTVLLPDADAGCSLEESCRPDDFRRFRQAHPDHMAISYINCSAEVKALSDIIITSSSAEAILGRLAPEQKIIFAPDKHLGAYLNKKTGRDMLLWDGACVVHEEFSAAALLAARAKQPGAKIAAHPECPEEILDIADFVGSTRKIINYVRETAAETFIIATEPHILHQILKESPGKDVRPAPGVDEIRADGSCPCTYCPYMGLNTMEKLYLALVNEAPKIEMNEELRRAALKPLQKMLEMSAPAVANAAE
jgi:quinolinate synthase